MKKHFAIFSYSINNEAVQRLLLMESELNLTKAVEMAQSMEAMAQSMEAAAQNSKEILGMDLLQFRQSLFSGDLNWCATGV